MAKFNAKSFSELYGVEYQRGMKAAIHKLTVLGRDAIQWAQRTRGYKHRTYNLYESYASAVYLNGNIVEESITHLSGPRASETIGETGKTGKELADEYLKAQHPPQTLALICVAAAPYAEYLEEGTYNSARRYYNSEEERWVSIKGEPYRPRGNRIQVISAAQDLIDRRWKSDIESISPFFKNVRGRVMGGDANYGISYNI